MVGYFNIFWRSFKYVEKFDVAEFLGKLEPKEKNEIRELYHIFDKLKETDIQEAQTKFRLSRPQIVELMNFLKDQPVINKIFLFTQFFFVSHFTRFLSNIRKVYLVKLLYKVFPMSGIQKSGRFLLL